MYSKTLRLRRWRYAECCLTEGGWQKEMTPSLISSVSLLCTGSLTSSSGIDRCTSTYARKLLSLKYRLRLVVRNTSRTPRLPWWVLHSFTFSLTLARLLAWADKRTRGHGSETLIAFTENIWRRASRILIKRKYLHKPSQWSAILATVWFALASYRSKLHSRTTQYSGEGTSKKTLIWNRPHDEEMYIRPKKTKRELRAGSLVEENTRRRGKQILEKPISKDQLRQLRVYTWLGLRPQNQSANQALTIGRKAARLQSHSTTSPPNVIREWSYLPPVFSLTPLRRTHTLNKWRTLFWKIENFQQDSCALRLLNRASDQKRFVTIRCSLCGALACI